MNKHLNLKLRAANLVKPPSFSDSNSGGTFFRLSAFQLGHAEPFVVVLESESVVGDDTPTWLQTSISLDTICSQQLDFPIMISVYACLGSTSTEKRDEFLVGVCETTVADLLRQQVGLVDNVDVSKVLKIKDDNRNERGILVVVEATISNQPVSSEQKHTNNSLEKESSLISSQVLERLQQALEDVLGRTKSLERETAELKFHNKRLTKKVDALEEQLERATKEISTMKHRKSSSTLIMNKLLDESLEDHSSNGNGMSKSLPRRARSGDMEKSATRSSARHDNGKLNDSTGRIHHRRDSGYQDRWHSSKKDKYVRDKSTKEKSELGGSITRGEDGPLSPSRGKTIKHRSSRSNSPNSSDKRRISSYKEDSTSSSNNERGTRRKRTSTERSKHGERSISRERSSTKGTKEKSKAPPQGTNLENLSF